MNQRRILIVDDDETILAMIKISIEFLLPGYQIITVKHGAAALAELRQQPVDLILTDYNMPMMNGLDLTQAARQISPEVPIFLMTASYSFDEIQSWAGAENLAGFLPKPFSMSQLCEILQQDGL